MDVKDIGFYVVNLIQAAQALLPDNYFSAALHSVSKIHFTLA